MGISVVKRDVTREPVDAMVNISNPDMTGTANALDRRVHAAAGSGLRDELPHELGGNVLEIGSAVVTRGARLKSLYVIHTPGPRWDDGAPGQADDFSRMVACCLDTANERMFQSLAFGSFQEAELGFPPRLMASLLFRKLEEWTRINRRGHLKNIVIATAIVEEHALFKTALNLMKSGSLLSLPSLTGDDAVWTRR